jgi:hypothetical protein
MIAVCSNGEVEAPDGSVLLDVSRRPTRAQPKPADGNGAPESEATHRAVAELRLAFEQTQRQIQESNRESEAAMSQLRNHAQELTREKEASQRDAAELRLQVQDLTKDQEARQREAAELRQQVQELTKDQEARQREAAELRETIEAQNKQLVELADRVNLMADREKELRTLLVDAHDQLLRRDEEIQILLAKALQHHSPAVTGAVSANRVSIPSSYLGYQLVIHQIREVAGRTLSDSAIVLVVSKGDTELMKLPVKETRHFPQREDGAYAGYYPADSAAAIAHLKECHARGAGYLLFPSTALWWFDYYKEFRDYLEDNFKLAAREEDSCVIFALNEPSAAAQRKRYQGLVGRIREAVRDTLPADATVLIVSKGDDQLMNLEGRRAWHFPQTEGGVYAGYNPADSAAAVEHLEQLRAKGADFILFPHTARWWLDHYEDFRKHLEGRYQKVLDKEDVGVLFALRPFVSEDARRYQEMLKRVREVARDALPRDAKVLVVSKGDRELLELDGRQAWHFPQQPDGEYAGHNPADSAAAIKHLEELRAKGADFLLLPDTARWWLDHYADFRKHLETRYQREVSDKSCVIYRIDRSGPAAVVSGALATSSVPGRAAGDPGGAAPAVLANGGAKDVSPG